MMSIALRIPCCTLPIHAITLATGCAGNDASHQGDHGGETESTEHPESPTYGYGAPHATPVQTHPPDVADAASAAAHAYASPQASEPDEIPFRYRHGIQRSLRPLL